MNKEKETQTQTFSLEELEEQGVDVEKLMNEPYNRVDPESSLCIELDLYEVYISEIKNNEKSLVNILDKRIFKNFEGEDHGLVSSVCHFHTEHTVPKIIYNPLVLSLWGLLESTIKGYAKYIYKKELGEEKSKTKFKNIKGDNKEVISFIDRADKYFNNEFNVGVNFENIEKIQAIRHLRNHLAHTNGSIENLKNGELEKIYKILMMIEGVDKEEDLKKIEVSFDSIVLSHDIIFYIYEIITVFLKQLGKTVSEKYNMKTNL